MIVEHTFVTILESADAFQAARRLLEGRGFLNVKESGPNPSTLELRRGKKTPARAKSIAELPQELRLKYDRGRVTVAISITPYDPVFWGDLKPLAHLGSDSEATSPRLQGHRDLIFAIAKSLEGLLARLEPPEQARALWEELELKLVLEAQKRRRRKWIIVAIVVAFLATVIFVGLHSAR